MGFVYLKFFEESCERINVLKVDGYSLKEAKVNFIVYWTDEEKKIEVKIILPELLFEKKSEL